MVHLIMGGAASGKSVYAERLANSLPGPKLYLATLRPFDEECRQKIQKHQTRRAKDGWQTQEVFGSMQKVWVPQGATVLLEDLSNLTANLLFGPNPETARDALLKSICHLAEEAKTLVLVGNDLFCDGKVYPPETMEYLQLLAQGQSFAANLADTVTEVVCGIPLAVKGPLPFAGTGWEEQA